MSAIIDYFKYPMKTESTYRNSMQISGNI